MTIGGRAKKQSCPYARGSNSGKQAKTMTWPCLMKRTALADTWKRWDTEQKIAATTLYAVMYPEVYVHIRRRIRLMQEALHENTSRDVSSVSKSLDLCSVFIKKRKDNYVIWYDESALQSPNFIFNTMRRVPQTVDLYAAHNDLIKLDTEKDCAFWVDLHFATDMIFNDSSAALQEWRYVANIYFVRIVKQMLQLMNGSLSFDTLFILAGKTFSLPNMVSASNKKRSRGGTKNNTCHATTTAKIRQSSSEKRTESETSLGKSARMVHDDEPSIISHVYATMPEDSSCPSSYVGVFAVPGWKIGIKNTFLHATPVMMLHRRSMSAIF